MYFFIRNNSSSSTFSNELKVLMSRLNESLHPALTNPILQILFSKSIFTALTFVRTNPEFLTRITGLQYSQILQIKDRILTKFSSTLRNGNKVYQEVLNHCAIIPSGIRNLDKLLDEGFMTGNVYELCGFSGCGKTQVCMTISANICLTTNQQVFFIDTKNDLSGQRLFEIIESHKGTNVGEVMKKIQICQIMNAYVLLRDLHQLEKKLKNSPEKFLGFKLIIIDSLSALFQQFQNTSEGLSVLNNIANLIKYICVEYHMVVLLTNYVSRWTADAVPNETENDDSDEISLSQEVQLPAMGKYWAHIPSARIMMKKLDASNDCYLIILKSSSQPVGKSLKVEISNSGVS